MNPVTAVPIRMHSICQPPFNEPSNGLVFEFRRPTVLQDCYFSFGKMNDLNIHTSECRLCGTGALPTVCDNIPIMLGRSVCVLVALAAASINAPAQWLNYSTPGPPRTRDGKPNLAAPAPREHGKPDLSGVWQVEPTPVEEMKRLFGDLSSDSALGDTPAAFSKYLVSILVDFKPGESPLRPDSRIWLASGSNRSLL